MKRILTIALLVCALALLLCVAAYAADAPTTAGIYKLKTETPAGLTVTVDPCTSTKAVVAKTTASIGGEDQDFYAEAEQLKVTVTGAAAGSQQLILAQSEKGSPTKDNIRYIDQYAVEGSALTFYVYPDKLEADKTYYIFVVGSDGNKIEIASFKYYTSYVLGDVNGNGTVDLDDAIIIMRFLVDLEELDDVQKLAADVNHNSSVDLDDAVIIMRFLVDLEEIN